MANIWHIAYKHRYDDIRIMEKECKSLAKVAGYQVTYITSNKNFNISTMKKNNYNVSIHVIPIIDGHRIFRVLRYISDVKKTMKRSKDKIDICHIHEFMLWAIVPFAKRRGIKVILDAHEDDINDLARTVRNNYGKCLSFITKKVMSVYQALLIKRADAFITVTYHIYERLKIYCRKSRIITNYPIWEENKRSRDFVDYENYSSVLCFAGGVSSIWMHENILKSMERLPECKYILAGRITQSYIEKLEKYSVWNSRTTYLGIISYEDVQVNVYEKSGIGMALCDKVICSDDNRNEGTLGNTKLFEFMQNGLPVICTNFNIWKRIVEKNNCGITVNPNNIDEIVDAICYLIHNPKEAYEMGQRGKQAVAQKYNWQNEEKKLYNLYEELLSQ